MSKQKFMNIGISLVALIAIGLGAYFYYQLHNLKVNEELTLTKEAEDLLSSVAKLYLIPTGEEPTIATVSDPNALRGQSFFTASQKGDKVLIFTKAGKAVLYRPSINKIIETAPINNSSTNQNATQTPDTTAPSKDKTF